MESFLRITKPYASTTRLLLPPNLNTQFKTIEFTTRVKTNSIGLREERELAKKRDNTHRIAVIGDSFTYGWGVNNDETFTSQLESLSNNSVAAKFQFINFGRPGENLQGYIRAFNIHAKRLNPDSVIIGFNPSNDCSSYPTGITDKRAMDAYAADATKIALHPWKKTSFYIGRLFTTRITKPIRAWIRNELIKLNYYPKQTGLRDPIDGNENPLSPEKLTYKLNSDPKAMTRYKHLLETGWIAKGLRWEVAPWLVLGAIFQPESLKKILLVDSKKKPAHRFQWQICMRVLQKFHLLVENLGSKFIIVILATPAQTSPEFLAARKSLGINIPLETLTDTRVNDQIMALCLKYSIKCIDTLPEFRKYSSLMPKQFFVIDGHPTKNAHALFASIIKREIAGILTR